MARDARTALACAFAALLCGCGGTSVALVNRAGGTLDHVSVAFTGGITPPTTIAVGKHAVVAFEPTGESDLKVSYRSSAGAQTCPVDTYIEPGDRARFRIELRETTCRVTAKEVTHPPFFGLGF